MSTALANRHPALRLVEHSEPYMTDSTKPEQDTERTSTTEPFTQIPNALLEAITLHAKGLAELKIILAVTRKTLGFQKQSDIISYSQFEEMTGLARSQIKPAIDRAVKSGAIERTELPGKVFQYTLLVGKTYYQYGKPTNIGRENLPELVGKTYTQKKDLNKKESTTPNGVAGAAIPDPAPETKKQTVEQPVKPEKPKKPIEPGQATDPPLSKHPAVKIYQDIMLRLPNPRNQQKIVEEVGIEPQCLAEWQKNCDWWAGHESWNKTNIVDLLKCYREKSYEQQRGPHLARNEPGKQLARYPVAGPGAGGAATGTGAGAGSNNGRATSPPPNRKAAHRGSRPDGRHTLEELTRI